MSAARAPWAIGKRTWTTMDILRLVAEAPGGRLALPGVRHPFDLEVVAEVERRGWWKASDFGVLHVEITPKGLDRLRAAEIRRKG